MRNLKLFVALVALMCISSSFAEKTVDEMCSMAHSNLQREAKKVVDNFKYDTRIAYLSIINMSYIIPKLMEVCEPITSELDLPEFGEDCTSQMNLINQVSQMIVESDHIFSSIFASHF